MVVGTCVGIGSGLHRLPVQPRVAALVVCVVVAGWLAGTARLQTLDADPLAPRVGHAVVDARVLVDEAWHGGGYGRIALGRILGTGGGPVLLRLSGRTGPDRGSILRSSDRADPKTASTSERGWRIRAYMPCCGSATCGRKESVEGLGDGPIAFVPVRSLRWSQPGVTMPGKWTSGSRSGGVQT